MPSICQRWLREGGMTVMYRPRAVFQLKRDRAHPKGSDMGGSNCNPSSAALLVDFVSCGKRRTTGAAVRELTGDFEGGTWLGDVIKAVRRGYGVDIDINTGSFDRVIKALTQGRGVTLCGSSIATRGTRHQASETFDGNHQWALTDIRHDASGKYEILVFDPLADGRRPRIAKSPMWIGADTVRKFAGNLDLRSVAEKAARKPRRPLGMGRATYGITERVDCGSKAAGAKPSTSVKLRRGASLVNGQVGKERTVGVPAARIRETPTTASDVVGRKLAGETFRAFQRIRGQRVAGDPIWFGDREGDRWMHRSLFKALTDEAAEPDPASVGEDPEAVATPDAPDDQGAEDDVLEGTEDGVDEEVVDDIAAEADAVPSA
jgi:hypothetical protein